MAFQDIRKIKKGWTKEDIRFILLVLVAIVILLSLNIFLARILPGGEWLSMRWNGARAFMFEGGEPYSATVGERAQLLAYNGRAASPAEYGYVLNDPFYMVLLYAPLAIFSDFTIARGIWMLFAEAALIGIVFLTLRLLEWQPPRWMTVSLVIFSLFSYYSLNSLISNSPAIFLTFIYLSILLAVRSFNDELAGALLFLIAYQWEVGAVILLFILVLVIANKRWAVFTGFGMTLFVLLIVSFLTYPGWLLPYVRAVLSDWYRGINLNFFSMASFWFPDSNIYLWVVGVLVLFVLLALEWIGAAQEHFRRIAWVACLSLAVTPLVGFPIFPSNHVALLPAFILIVMLIQERWNKRQTLAGAIVLMTGLLVPFGLYAASFNIPSFVYKDLLTVLPPVATIIALYWMRWFAVRSPRTWLDQVGLRK